MLLSISFVCHTRTHSHTHRQFAHQLCSCCVMSRRVTRMSDYRYINAICSCVLTVKEFRRKSSIHTCACIARCYCAQPRLCTARVESAEHKRIKKNRKRKTEQFVFFNFHILFLLLCDFNFSFQRCEKCIPCEILFFNFNFYVLLLYK